MKQCLGLRLLIVELQRGQHLLIEQHHQGQLFDCMKQHFGWRLLIELHHQGQLFGCMKQRFGWWLLIDGHQRGQLLLL
jgi:hypothetical protein